MYFLKISLQVADPLKPHQLKDQHLGLQGEHQYINAGLAVALASTWLEKQGHVDRMPLNHTVSLVSSCNFSPKKMVRSFVHLLLNSGSLTR